MALDKDTAPPIDATARGTAPPVPSRLSPRVLVVAFVVLAVAIVGVAWWTAGEFAAAERSAAARQIATVADLRMEQLIEWQGDRAGDATVLHGDTVLAEWIGELFGGIASEERSATLSSRLAALRAGYGYESVTLYDRSGREWLSSVDSQAESPAAASADATMEALVRRALDSRRIATSDLMPHHTVPSRTGQPIRLHLHTAAPLMRHGSGEPVGVIVLGYDATRALAGYLQGVEASGPRVDLRLVPDQPGDETVIGAGGHLGTLERLGSATPGVFAQTRRTGETVVATRDEAGRPVLAMARAVPNTSWQLVASLETARIDATIASERNQMMALAVVGLVLVAAVLVTLRREQELSLARTRLAAQASLDESEARFHVFMDNSPAIAFLKDEQGRLLYTNAAFRRAFSFGESDWFGRTSEELWPAETASALMRNDRAVLETDMPGLFEQEHPGEHGTTVWLVSKFPFHDSAGRRFLGGTAVDITERRRVEAALRESEQRYRRLFTGAKAVELLIDPTDARIVDANDAAEAFYGLSRDALTSLRLTEIDCQPPEEVAADMALAMAQARSHFHLRHRLASGEVRDVEVHSGPIQEGERNLLYSIVHDVTDRRRAERALAEATAALERSNAELERLAMRDALTGVSNRRHFTAVAARDTALARRHRWSLSVLMIDIDHFKAVNDTHGHAVGDEVLRVLAGVFLSVLRATDHLGRFGGEEFVVLLPDTGLDGAATTAERLRAAVAATPFKGRDGEPITCTISVGVSGWSPADASIEEALKRADTALYDAKRAGRNAVRCAVTEPAV